MTRMVWDYDRKDWVLPAERSRGPNAGPSVISDQLDYVMNHADGQRYTSKRAYERAVRANGCEIIGNEKLPERRAPEPAHVERDIVHAIRQLGG